MSAADEAYDRLHGVDGHTQADDQRGADGRPAHRWRGIRCSHEGCAEFGICLIGSDAEVAGSIMGRARRVRQQIETGACTCADEPHLNLLHDLAVDLAVHGDCRCGCPTDMHVGEIGCPCGLPDEQPCAQEGCRCCGCSMDDHNDPRQGGGCTNCGDCEGWL